VNGVFDRHPRLRVYFAETQASWLAYTLTNMDDFYRRQNHYLGLELKRMPSEYYVEHCLFSFVTDRVAMKLLSYIDIDMLMWGTDFPHSAGTFPNSKEWLDDLFEGASDADRRQVLVENPCRFFHLDPTRSLSTTPANREPVRVSLP
jgi:predicted TIM-barrel fold metal-dependent hydrolase